MFFKKLAQSGKARAGIIKTAHGEIETPIFMPVATSAAIKGVHNKDLIESISPSILSIHDSSEYTSNPEDIIGSVSINS